MRNSIITDRSNDVLGIRQDRAVVAGAERAHASASLARSLSFGHLHLLAEKFATTLTRYWQMAAMATTKRATCAVVVVTPPVGRSVRAVPRVSVVRT